MVIAGRGRPFSIGFHRSYLGFSFVETWIAWNDFRALSCCTINGKPQDYTL